MKNTTIYALAAVALAMILLGGSTAPLGAAVLQHVITGNGASSLQAVDLDDDGDIDLLPTSSSSDGRIVWYENGGNGQFATRNISTTASGTESLHAADFDGDGDLDIVAAVAYDDRISWYENVPNSQPPAGPFEADSMSEHTGGYLEG